MRDYINEAFASISCGADLPGDPPRVHEMQNRSDRLREKAKDFAISIVALTPDTRVHQAVVDEIHDIVLQCENAIAAHFAEQWKTANNPISLPERVLRTTEGPDWLAAHRESQARIVELEKQLGLAGAVKEADKPAQPATT